MSGRSAKQAVTVLVATVVCATVLAAGVISGPAGASTLTSADGFTTLTTQGTVTAQTPYSGGQTVDLQVAANPTMDNASLVAAGFPSGAVTIKFLECADPGGLVANLPTKPSECEPGTIHSISGANANGSMSLTGTNGYQVLALPDPNLGSSNGTTCGLAPHQCVIGIFTNQNDFSKPHLFSAPFASTLGDGLDDGANPGDGTQSLATAPGAPTIGTASAGNGSATVSFTAPTSNGGAAITHYTVTAADSTNAARGGETATGTVGPLAVTGLTNGDRYTFTVTATNSVGTGPASGPSASVVPLGPGITVVQSTLPSVAVGGTYSVPLTELGSTGTVKWKVTAGALPRKIKLGKSGILGGTVTSGKHPTATGTYTFTITVTQKGKKGAPTLTGTGTFSILVTAT